MDPQEPPQSGASARLAAIVALDVAGYSALAEADEAAAIAAVAALRQGVQRIAARHGGRVFSSAGDGFMLAFATPNAALAALAEALDAPEAPALRGALHVGEVTEAADGDLLGHGVNVTARLQMLAKPGEALVSAAARAHIRGEAAERLKPRGRVRLSKMLEVVQVYVLKAGAKPAKARLAGWRWTPLRAGGLMALPLMMIALVAAFFTAWERPSPAPRDPLIVVVPFDNLGGTPEAQLFSDGVAEEILNTLARSGQLRVAARASSFEFRGPRKTQAAKALGATHVLDGAVRREGDRVRITAYLIDAARNETIWSETFDRRLAQSLQMQDEIAGKVAEALQVRLAAPAANRRLAEVDPRAYELYLRGREAWRHRTKAKNAEAIRYLSEAAERAPDFSPAFSALAAAYRINIQFSPPDMQDEDRRRGAEAAERAIELDPNNGEAFAALAMLTPVFNNWEDVEELFNAGLQAEPNNSTLLHWRAIFLERVGRVEESIAAMARAHELDPLAPRITLAYARQLFENGRFAEADALIDGAAARWPGSEDVYWTRFDAHVYAKRYRDARAILRAGVPESLGKKPAVVSDILALLSAMESASPKERAAIMARYKAKAAESQQDALTAVSVMVEFGDTAGAFTLAEQVFGAERSGFSNGADHTTYFALGEPDTSVLFERDFASLQRNSRFIRMLANIGLPQYWAATDRWPDFCKSPGLGYDCRAEALKFSSG